jgi:MFS transporter, DHA1 family, solute carrier family 18 (vesicular amine transporter), member 1/2
MVAAPQRRRIVIVGIAVAAVTIDTALLGVIAPLLPDVEERTGAGEGALGLTLAAYAIPIALLSLPLGRMADRIGRRLLLAVGLLLVAAGSGLIALADSLAILTTARAVQGVGSAASWISALALVSDTAPPDRRGEMLGVALGATAAGSIAGPALGGVMADVLSFEAPFLLFAAVSLVLLAVALTVLPRDLARDRAPAPVFAPIARAMRAGSAVWASSAMLASACVLGLIEVVAPLDLDRRLGLSSAAIGLLFAASIAVDAVLAPLGGRWGDRRGRRIPAVVGLAATAISLILLAALPGWGGAAVALVVYGAGFSLAMTATVPWLDEAFDESERGLAYGVQNLLYAGGYAVGPLAGGALLLLGGPDLAYWLTAALFGCGTVLLVLVSPRQAD